MQSAVLWDSFGRCMQESINKCKTIKIKYVGFWSEFDPETFNITMILRKHFDVKICDDADFVITSCINNFYDILDYPQVRIMYIGENYIPDMNLIDYSISPYPVKMLDRCFHLPQSMKADKENAYLAERSLGKNTFGQDFMRTKTAFANFCASHESEHNIRGDFFKKLCEYKKVDSIGTYLNNTGIYVKGSDGTKRTYQKKCKFSLCFESTSHVGFNTEKIVDAFASDTIPVYYGDPYIGDIFNKKAFIDLADFASVDEAIQKIIELDNDDEKYLEMLNQPIFVDPEYPVRLGREYEEFLVHIFEQSPEDAYRRCRIYYPHYHESFLKTCRMLYYNPVVQLLLKIKRKFF